MGSIGYEKKPVYETRASQIACQWMISFLSPIQKSAAIIALDTALLMRASIRRRFFLFCFGMVEFLCFLKFNRYFWGLICLCAPAQRNSAHQQRRTHFDETDEQRFGRDIAHLKRDLMFSSLDLRG